MREIGIGLYGSGFMAKTHAIGYAGMPTVFSAIGARPRRELIADVTDELARAAARRLGFARHAAGWQALIEDPRVEIVDITAPSKVHREIALAAIARGKHVYCEKPLGLNAAEASEMAAAAAAKGVRTLVGFNYLRNPMIRLARQIVEADEIGTIVHVRGAHAEDFLYDPEQPYSWRCDRTVAGAGALGDLGSHSLSLMRYLAGEITEVCGEVRTVIKERPIARGSAERHAVDNDDIATALLRFANGATGSLEASRVAVGRKMFLAFEITGTKGALRFNQERFNELELAVVGRPGVSTIVAGPEHAPYGDFCPAAGHQLGFNDLKVIEIALLIDGIASDKPLYPDFAEAARIARVIDAILASHAEGRWVRVEGSARETRAAQ